MIMARVKVVSGSFFPLSPIIFGQKVENCCGSLVSGSQRTTPWPRVHPELITRRRRGRRTYFLSVAGIIAGTSSITIDLLRAIRTSFGDADCTTLRTYGVAICLPKRPTVLMPMKWAFLAFFHPSAPSHQDGSKRASCPTEMGIWTLGRIESPKRGR
jgi:hypothetical protein